VHYQNPIPFDFHIPAQQRLSPRLVMTYPETEFRIQMATDAKSQYTPDEISVCPHPSRSPRQKKALASRKRQLGFWG
jgi:hypothetical protein